STPRRSWASSASSARSARRAADGSPTRSLVQPPRRPLGPGTTCHPGCLLGGKEESVEDSLSASARAAHGSARRIRRHGRELASDRGGREPPHRGLRGPRGGALGPDRDEARAGPPQPREPRPPARRDWLPGDPGSAPRRAGERAGLRHRGAAAGGPVSAALELTSEQGRAVELATRDYPPVMVITGGPGTGKSTVLRTILDEYQSQGLRALLMAPSGKAAVRMQEATGRPAFTIHSALGLFNGGAFRQGGIDYADVVVVDECSMVDSRVMAAVF